VVIKLKEKKLRRDLMREVMKNERGKEKLEKVRVTRLMGRKEFFKRL
jgi:hypothetical protein